MEQIKTNNIYFKIIHGLTLIKKPKQTFVALSERNSKLFKCIDFLIHRSSQRRIYAWRSLDYFQLALQTFLRTLYDKLLSEMP